MKKRNSYSGLWAGLWLLVIFLPVSLWADTGDGSVVSVTKIQDNGPDTLRFNIVIMGDGYRSAELPTFETKAQQVVAAFNANIAFGHCGGAVNFYRVNIASTESGSDKPCNTPPISKATYLDSRYCQGGTQRCIWSSNIGLIISTANSATANWHFIVVLVNDAEHGGCAGSGITFSSTGTGFTSTAMHELGHALGGLADEYEYGGTPVYSGPEPGAVNLTTQISRENVKWYDLILETTPVPTWESVSCTNTVNSTDTRIGTHEGGGYHYCDIYHPSGQCLMRILGVEFCQVCQRRIQQILLPHYSTSNLSITPWGYFKNPKVNPYWQTPDVWCDNNGNSIQEANEPSIGLANNHLFARIKNTGTQPSGTYQVRFSYVPYTTVIDLANEQLIHTTSRPSLGAGGTDIVEVNWNLTYVPPAFAGINHFCVLVQIITDECPTYDNSAQNNFCNIPTTIGEPAPMSFYIKNILDVNAIGAIMVEPKLDQWKITSNVQNLDNIPLRPNEEKLITLKFNYEGKCDRGIDISASERIQRAQICARANFDVSFKLNGQLLGGVSSVIIVHPPAVQQRKLGLSLHSGKTFPLRDFDIVFDGGLMFGVDVDYRLTSRFSLLGLAGLNLFNSSFPKVDDTSWWNFSFNFKYELGTTSIRPYINGGPGMYLPKKGKVKPGLNVGCGVDYSVSPPLTIESGVNYHHIFTDIQNTGFLVAHVGLIFNF